MRENTRSYRAKPAGATGTAGAAPDAGLRPKLPCTGVRRTRSSGDVDLQGTILLLAVSTQSDLGSGSDVRGGCGRREMNSRFANFLNGFPSRPGRRAQAGGGLTSRLQGRSSPRFGALPHGAIVSDPWGPTSTAWLKQTLATGSDSVSNAAAALVDGPMQSATALIQPTLRSMG